MQKALIVIGIIFILIGVLLPWILRLGLGHLPGDIIIKRVNFTFYFPIMTSIILSVLLSVLLWVTAQITFGVNIGVDHDSLS